MEQSQTLRPGGTGVPLAADFHVRKLSGSGLVRVLAWLMFGGLFVVLLWASHGRAPVILMAVIGGLLPLLCVEYSLARRAPLNKPLLTVNAGGIGASVFSRKRPHYRWSDLAGLDLRSVHGVPTIVLHPKTSDASGRSGWFGRRAPRGVRVSLGPLARADRLRALDAVAQHMRAAGGVVTDDLAQERAFQEQVKSLAPHCWGLYTIIAANVAVWLAMVWRGAPFEATPVPMLMAWGGNLAVAVQDGQWWRLATSMFLHGGLKHLATNMVVLYTVGVLVERLYGTRAFLLIYFGAGLLGSALSMHFAAQHAVSVGASGAVFGVAGALLVVAARHRHHLPPRIHKQLITDASIMIGYSLFQGFIAPRVDNGAHIGGLIGGCLLALCVPVRLDPSPVARRSARGMLAGIAVGAAAVATVGLSAPVATPTVRNALALEKQFEQGLKAFAAAMEDVKRDNMAVKAGTISEQEADIRSRTVHAPVFERVVSDLVRIPLPSGDARALVLQDLTLMADLLHESLQMESDPDPRTGKMVARDPARMAEIEAEITRLGTQLQQRQAALMAKGK